jgi:3',5'-cyclic AMP phosphodiesterase CpdA
MKNQHSFSRRHFVKNISFASAFFAGGGFRSFSEQEVNILKDQVVMRFAVASDSHYGQPDTPYEAMMDTIIEKINLFHGSNPLDFCVMNGDIVHDEKSFLPLAKKKLDGFRMPYYVTRGNHDKCSPDFWQNVWNMPLNHKVVVKDSVVLLGDTSNEQGTYVSPDLAWLASQLEANKMSKNVFLFLHIPQAKWTKNGIETPEFFKLVKQFPNIRAVFHGHEHDQDGVQMVGKLPFLFDSHIGGSWGTPHKGFRVVELLANGTVLTYLMDPTIKRNELAYEF